MPPDDILIRTSVATDFDEWFQLFDSVAAEGKWVGSESPMDRESRREGFLRFVDADDATTFVARANGKLVGTLGVENHRGVGEIGMHVHRAWRGGGVGSALMGACVDWAREHSAHKLSLTVWPHNEAAIALYRKFGFEPEGLLRRHYRRKNGQLWDAIAMGLILDTESPGSPF